MAPYWISLVLAVGFMALSQRFTVTQGEGGKICARDGRLYARWGIIASLLVFVVLTGFRYGVGQDYFYTYVPYFQRVRAGYAQPDAELGFYALNWLVSRFTDDPTPVFLSCSVLFFSFAYAAIMRESSHPVMSVFLIFGMSYLFIFMNAMRQMTAVAILLFALRYIERRAFGRFLVCVIAASLFHVSSLIFLVAYWFPKLKIGIASCLALVVAFFALRPQIAGVVNAIISQTMYGSYIGSAFDTGETGSVVIAMNLVVLFFSAIVPRVYGTGYSDRYRLLLWCQLVSSLVAILSGFIPLSQRVRWVFSLPSIILLPLAIDSIGNAKLRFLVQAGVIVLYVIYIAITIGLWNGNNVVPYRSVLFGGGF